MPPCSAANSVSPAQNEGRSGRDRRLQGGEEGGDVGQRLHAEQPLRPQEAQQQHEGHGEQQAHQHQDVAGAAGGEDVDEHERDHASPGATGIDDEGHEGERRRST